MVHGTGHARWSEEGLEGGWTRFKIPASMSRPARACHMEPDTTLINSIETDRLQTIIKEYLSNTNTNACVHVCVWGGGGGL